MLNKIKSLSQESNSGVNRVFAISSHCFLILLNVYSGYGPTTPHIKEIPHTKLLISLDYASMEIFDISKSKQIRKLYSFEEVLGGIIVTGIH